MNSQIIIECIGYLGSLLVVVSMLLTSVKKLRIVNTVGCVIFAGYALIIKSYPTAFMNLCLVGINVYNLIKLKKKEHDYRVIECFKDESIIRDYLTTYAEDINKFFPEFINDSAKKQAFLVCSDSRPVGLMVGDAKDDSTFDIELDYTIPAYRDCSVGSFLFNHMETEKGFSKFLFSVSSLNHENYLMKMGFTKNGNIYIKQSSDIVTSGKSQTY